ncbi:restriction endonuclease subunit S [Bacillus salipaludis]|uniref:restriction endonuclease subunit S n=1 Tax=Bacillus salipaludis TaxID=2547811 RepID=UPI003D1E7859
MNNQLKPYGKYKETEYDWLGCVPDHWRKVTIRTITKLSNERNGNRNDLELLSVYREYGVIKKSSRDDNHNVESQDLSNYKFVNKGYLVLNKMKMWQGSLGVSKYKGIVSPAYIVCKLIGDLNFNYIHYLLRSTNFKTLYNRISYGVRVGQWDMRYDDFKNVKLFIPTLAEQDQIVKYLDSQLAKINKFIKTKKKLILALREQKQAVINEVVTKGINPNVKMKPSGIDWLGDIPEHWEVRKMKYLGKFINGYAFPSDRFTEAGVRVMKISNIQTMNIDWTDESFVDESYYWERSAFRVLNGDLVLALTRPIISTGIKAAFVYSNDKILLNQRNALFRAGDKLSSSWLYFVIFNSAFIKTFDQKIDKTGQQPNISTIDIQNISVPLPSIGEQQEIVEYLESKINVLDNGISIIEQEISLMTEYRTRLISDVVTGKVDVRGIEVDYIEAEELDIDGELVENEEVLDLEECEV